MTLAAVDEGQRVTTDIDVTLSVADGRATRLRDDLAQVETKTEEGQGTTDRLLGERGQEPVTISSTDSASGSATDALMPVPGANDDG